MNSAAVNLGAGGFVSYFEDGGASVVLEKRPDLNYVYDPENAPESMDAQEMREAVKDYRMQSPEVGS